MAIKMRVLCYPEKKKALAIANLIKAKYELSVNAVDRIPSAYACDRERIVILMVNLKANLTDEYTRYIRELTKARAANVAIISAGSEEGVAKPNAVAQELVKNMLAEKRAQGLGIVIADQSPEKVTGDVIKLTNIKLGFNLVEKNDKEIFADSTNMDDKQVERMTQLIEGEAFFFMGGMSRPEEVSIPDYRRTHNIDVTICKYFFIVFFYEVEPELNICKFNNITRYFFGRLICDNNA